MARSKVAELKDIVARAKGGSDLQTPTTMLPSVETALKKLTGIGLRKYKAEKIKELSKLEMQRCRVCGFYKEMDQFSSATNPLIDTNGKMSICSTCLNKMFDDMFSLSGDYYKTFAKICRDIDLKYDENFVSKAIDYAKAVPYGVHIFKKYWDLVLIDCGQRQERATFSDSKFEAVLRDSASKHSNNKELIFKWGADFSDSDYAFLEHKYTEYVNAYGASTPSEGDTIKTLCILLLRQITDPANKDITAALRDQYKIMGISPETLRKENRDKGAKILGVDIATIELTEPAEYIEDKKLYFDHDGLERDKQDLLRAQKNHLIGTKDFTSTDIDVSEIFSAEEE